MDEYSSFGMVWHTTRLSSQGVELYPVMQIEFLLLTWCELKEDLGFSYRKISLQWCNVTAATGASGVCFYVLLFHNRSNGAILTGKVFSLPWGHWHSKCLCYWIPWVLLLSFESVAVCMVLYLSQVCVVRRLRYFIVKWHIWIAVELLLQAVFSG